MNQYPSPGPGDPWQQPRQDPSTGWNPAPEYGALEPYGSPGGGYVPAPTGPAAGSVEEPLLSTIGDIAITRNTVITPGGRFPIRGTVWTVTDMSRTESNIPVWAIIVAILFIWACLLSLLFLLVKDRKTTGHIQVTVQGHGHYHAASIPAAHPGLGAQINQQVNYARSLAA
ncbi:hypothetical protein PWG71_08700 [Nocardiopsis sp. N85]|uniref:hypothetical protein n=1 Tax=Nocardiopsis sp. N85 TaxID=3029400 RepID=UPI00237F5E04|nr:hypothetical protein [Nocardiopsis sp. N85]MDE3721466.1 hypothetical protein [Nocardiopsis sp. N85]